MRLPTRDQLARLLNWRPDGGVISVYLPIDRGDRGGGWRIELRNRLSEISSRSPRRQFSAVTQRIEETIGSEERPPSGRTQIGFVEAGDGRRAHEEWFATQVPVAATIIVHRPGPLLMPLVRILDLGASRAIGLVSAERVRLLRWMQGTTEEIESWGLEIISLDWRERKAQRPADPGQAQGVTASGKDQFSQRLEANRERFLHEAGRLAAERARDLELGDMIVIGPRDHSRPFTHAASVAFEVEAPDAHDLIAAPLGEIAPQLDRIVSELNEARERELVERASDAARAGGRGALGLQETSQALDEGRVDHLLLGLDLGARPVETAADELSTAEGLVARALETGARVTTVSGEAAELLADADGVAALLRY